MLGELLSVKGDTWVDFTPGFPKHTNKKLETEIEIEITLV